MIADDAAELEASERPARSGAGEPAADGAARPRLQTDHAATRLSGPRRSPRHGDGHRFHHRLHDPVRRGRRARSLGHRIARASARGRRRPGPQRWLDCGRTPGSSPPFRGRGRELRDAPAHLYPVPGDEYPAPPRTVDEPRGGSGSRTAPALCCAAARFNNLGEALEGRQRDDGFSAHFAMRSTSASSAPGPRAWSPRASCRRGASRPPSSATASGGTTDESLHLITAKNLCGLTAS